MAGILFSSLEAKNKFPGHLIDDLAFRIHRELTRDVLSDIKKLYSPIEEILSTYKTIQCVLKAYPGTEIFEIDIDNMRLVSIKFPSNHAVVLYDYFENDGMPYDDEVVIMEGKYIADNVLDLTRFYTFYYGSDFYHPALYPNFDTVKKLYGVTILTDNIISIDRWPSTEAIMNWFTNNTL